MRGLIAVVAAVAIGLVAGRFSVQPVARAQSGCTNASLKGSYGYVINGFFYDQDLNQGVYAEAGGLVADGNGALTGVSTSNVDGTVQRGQKFSGTYTINADCSGNMTLTDASGNAMGLRDIVLTNGGKQVAMVDADTNIIISGTATQQ